jgi:hypothetical protein
MKDFKGTPGPWSQGRLLSTTTTKKWDKETWDRMAYSESLVVFANFNEEDQGRSRRKVARCECPEDAKLIAASKDMAEALQGLIGSFEIMGYTFPFLLKEDCYLSAKAALSKALD